MRLIRWIAAWARRADLPRHWLGLVAGLLFLVSVLCAPAGGEQTARQILDTADIQGGLIVHIGCGDGNVTAALHASDSHIVQGLDTDATAARQTIQSRGLYGRVTAERWTGERLPYVDNLVNLVVAGTPVAFPEDDLAKAYDGRLGGILWAVSASTGEKLAEYKLDAAPVWDSIAVAQGCLYIATQDGAIHCFAEKR